MVTLDEEARRAKERTQMRRLRGRERLIELASQSAPPTDPVERELQRLHVYLKDWQEHQHRYRGAPSEGCGSTLAQFVKDSTQTAGGMLEQSDGWAMAVIDASIVDLHALQPDGGMLHAALRVRWLNEGLSRGSDTRVRVFRSGRLQHVSLEAADALADRAELALLAIVKRRGLPL